MKNSIVISGYYGFSNPGDEAILKEIIETLKNGHLTPIVLYNTKKTFIRDGVIYIPRYNPISFLWYIINSLGLISGGGGLFQDSTSFLSFIYYFLIVVISSFLNKKVIIYGQSFGPVRRPFLLNLFQLVLKCSDIVFVRDTYSIGFAFMLLPGMDKKIFAMPDVVYGRKISRDNLKREKNLLVFPRRVGDIGALIKMLGEIKDAFNINIIIIPMHYNIDLPIAKFIFDNLQRDAKLYLAPCSIECILNTIKRSSWVISYRLHGLIFSHITFTPFIGISYDPKLISFLQDLNMRYILPNKKDISFLKRELFWIYTRKKVAKYLYKTYNRRQILIKKINRKLINFIRREDI